MKSKLIIALIVLLIIIGGGVLAGFLLNRGGTPGAALRDSIDRGIKPEDRARIKGKITETEEAIGGDRDVADLELWLELGNYHNILGNLKDAEEIFLTVTHLNALNSVAWANLASVRDERGNLRGAEEAYRKAIDLAPVAIFYEKYANFLKNKFPDRTSDYEALLKIAVAKLGQLPEFIGALAIFYEEQGRYEDALSHYRVLLPENQAIQNDIRRVEEKMRK